MTDSVEGPRKRSPVPLLAIIAGIIAGALIFYFKSNKPKNPIVVKPEVPTRDAGAALANSTVGVEARARGMKALAAGDYDEAVAEFTAAVRAPDAPSDIPELLALVGRLRQEANTRDAAATRVAEVERPVRKERRSIEPRKRAVRRRTTEKKKQPELAEVSTGKLLVVTRPPGLAVYVDGQARDLSPARIDLEPGRHEVEVRSGSRILFTKRFSLRAEDVVAVDEDLTAEMTPASAEPAAVASKGLRNSRDLDLVELIEGDKENTAAAKDIDSKGKLDLVELIDKQPPTDSDASGSKGAALSGPVKVYVYAPRSLGPDFVSSLRNSLSGVSVKSFSSFDRLRRQAAEDPPDAVISLGSLVRSAGYAAGLQSEARSGSNYVLASRDQPLDRSRWASARIGVAGSRSRSQAASLVARSLGLKSPPPLKRVSKTEDLLPLLQFSMADAVLIESKELDRLQTRTKLSLASTPLSSVSQELLVGFADGARRSSIETGLKNMAASTRRSLGISAWSQP